MAVMNAMRARARGCLLGQLTGDALGTTVEFMSAARIASLYPDGLSEVVGGGPFRVAAGQVTDDSELALALARTLAAEGADFDAIARAYVAWCASDPIDIGGTTINAFSGRAGGPVDEATVSARAAEYNGHPKKQANGSLMRVSPLAIYGATLPAERLAELARRDSRLSHPTPACVEACVAFTRAIAVAISELAGPERAYEAALVAVDTPAGRESGVHGWLVEARDAAPVCDAGGIGWVATALKNAFYQLLHAESFEAGLIATVMAGGDTDTNGAIAGALLGAVHGELDIPARWRDAVLSCRPQRPVVYHAHDARELAQRLLERGAHDPTSEPTPAQIDELLHFLAWVIHAAGEPVLTWLGTEPVSAGVLALPRPIYGSGIYRLFEVAGQHHWMDPKYVPEDTQLMLEDHELVARASLAQLKTMITYCVRGERFCDGHWGAMVREGHVTRLLTRLRELREAMDAPHTG